MAFIPQSNARAAALSCPHRAGGGSGGRLGRVGGASRGRWEGVAGASGRFSRQRCELRGIGGTGAQALLGRSQENPSLGVGDAAAYLCRLPNRIH